MNMKADVSNKATSRPIEKDGDFLHTFQILDEVSKGKSITQRDLSKKLGIALGMINSYLKRLARQGYIQIVQAEGKRLHYLLTPLGIAKKSALTYRYVKKSYQVFTEARDRIRHFFDNLAKEGVKSVVLYKASVVAEIAILVLQDSPIDLVAIVDETGMKGNFWGYKIQPLESLSELQFDRILITTEVSDGKAIEKLRHYGVESEKILFLG